MPNLILTSSCNNKCAYCFTNGAFLEDLTLKNLKEISPFISSFQNKKLNILGGEPSLNPEFITILQYLLSEEYELLIFTNGDISPSILVQLQGLMCGGLEFVVNRTDNLLTANTIRFYKALGHRIKIGLTIFKSGQYVQHALREIEEYRLRKAIRIGIALPSYVLSSNTFLSREAYPQISNEIFPFLVECIGKGIRPEFDCGFPYCFFTDEQKDFFRDNAVDFASNCGLIPDILPNQTVVPCFPLARFTTGIDRKSSWAITKDEMDVSIAGVRGKSLYEACSACEYMESLQCSKGCAAFHVHPASS
ncbi:MAG: 4Fe-4S cluster-binding domain-containing protein [Ignavibacteriales bacterium]|nr:4Fe-4S cluster-binding domain-containing protein [Ignavibacteriales bacterium]